MASNLEVRLDTQFSLFIRLSRATHEGFLTCYTCPRVIFWSEADCGHWQKRGNHGTRWDEDNCRPQCFACNRHHNGRPGVFEEELIDEIGEDRVTRLVELARSAVSFSDEELRQKLKHYTAIVDKMGKPQ